MNSTPPAWVEQVHACDVRAEGLRDLQGRIADERAWLIADAVAEYGRGGRHRAAELLGVKVLQIDAAIKRVRSAPRPSDLPHDLLERLYALELAELPPLPAPLWQDLAQILMGTIVDVTWLDQPAELLAQEVEDVAGDELASVDAEALAAAIRSWSRIQALAVIDALQRGGAAALPSKD
jgi:hypothetical protein